MTRDPGSLVTPIVAIALFAIVAFQTVGALRASGAWSGVFEKRSATAVARPEDPFTPIGALLERPQPDLPAGPMRDPFTLGAAPTSVVSHAPVARKSVTPAAPARPVLTAIVWDNDPRAIIRWQGHDFTVHAGALFAEFQVAAITRDQVTLNRGTETIVLQRKPQGD